jgi:hypothetical protein
MQRERGALRLFPRCSAHRFFASLDMARLVRSGFQPPKSCLNFLQRFEDSRQQIPHPSDERRLGASHSVASSQAMTGTRTQATWIPLASARRIINTFGGRLSSWRSHDAPTFWNLSAADVWGGDRQTRAKSRTICCDESSVAVLRFL